MVNAQCHIYAANCSQAVDFSWALCTLARKIRRQTLQLHVSRDDLVVSVSAMHADLLLLPLRLGS